MISREKLIELLKAIDEGSLRELKRLQENGEKLAACDFGGRHMIAGTILLAVDGDNDDSEYADDIIDIYNSF